MEERSVCLDGPSGAGKSTLARLAAEKFGFIYVDTGALYRSIGLHVWRNGIDSKDESRVAELLPDIHLELQYDDEGVQRVLLNGKDVTDDIRLPPISIYASDVSAMPAVRAFLLDMQRDMAARYDTIMDGRDIGTVVLPNAGLKVFLTASPNVRAGRRYAELVRKGVKTTPEEVLRDINYRDSNDSSRANAPLRAADDAVHLDTSRLDLNHSFEKLCELIRERFGL
ncbi:MAG: (d)CMP kinase [Oscillospiraceae bacterium]|jgi:cytidylate kinase|nr:(d)CMP kinase [Oscillospiraceae bacterium]